MSDLVVEAMVRRVGVHRRAVLNGVSLRVDAGTVAVVVGPSPSTRAASI